MADERFRMKPVTEEDMDQLITGGKFEDTGRQGSVAEKLDSMFGAPVRTGISEAQKGNFNLEALKKIASSVGTDPMKAPTGVDIAEQAGIKNPYVGAAAATLADLAQLPTPGMGVSGAIKSVAADEVKAAFPKLKQMFSVGGKTFPANSAAEAMEIKAALEKVNAIKPKQVMVKE